MKQARTYYLIRFCLDGAQGYLIWYDDDQKDGVVLTAPDRVAVFRGLPEAAEHAASHVFQIKEEERLAVYDFDRLEAWLSHPSREEIDCAFFLNMWNLFTDVAHSIGAALAETPKTSDVYDTLFWGCNLPSITPAGEHFEPSWAGDSVSILSEFLSSGLMMMRGALGKSDPT